MDINELIAALTEARDAGVTEVIVYDDYEGTMDVTSFQTAGSGEFMISTQGAAQ